MRRLIDEIDDFLAVHPEVLPSHLGEGAVRDKSLVAQLRRGRQPREGTVAKVRSWMAEYARRAAARRRAARQAAARVERMIRDCESGERM
jgi:hypothetical protein